MAIKRNTGCFKSSFRFKIVFCAKHLILLSASVNWFREETYLNNHSKQFQTKIWTNYNFLKFLPELYTYARFFPPYFSCHFVCFLFWYFYRFLLFSLFLHHENEGLHCSVLELRHLFLWSSGHSVEKKKPNCWRGLNDDRTSGQK